MNFVTRLYIQIDKSTTYNNLAYFGIIKNFLNKTRQRSLLFVQNKKYGFVPG